MTDNQTTVVDLLKEIGGSFHAKTIAENAKILNVDLIQLHKEHEYMFNLFTRICETPLTEESAQLWNNYKAAYDELHEAIALNVKTVAPQIMQQMLSEFTAKVNGPCLVPINEIQDTLSELNKKGVVSVLCDFNDFMDLVEKYYNFEHRGFFNSARQQIRNSSKKLMGMSDADYEKYSRISPQDSVEAAKLCLLSAINDKIDGVKYVDFWHHLLEYDFNGACNGCYREMYADDIEEPKEDATIDEQVFTLIRKLIFKELSQLPNLDVSESITFSIYW